MSKKKILMYNGGKEHYYGCNSPEVLTKGKLYEIIAEEDICGCQTYYTLNGIEGAFNSIWFSEPNSYFGYTDTVPVEGKYMTSITLFDGIHIGPFHSTSPVRYIESITPDIYKVYTQNALYIVKVLKEES